MAKLWGTSTTNENKPNWLTDTDKENCFATTAGWVYRHPDGTEEVLVSIKGLSLAAKLSTATITNITFSGGVYTAGLTKQVRIQFNEKVTVAGGTPTLVVTGSIDGAITATYASTNTAGNTLVFDFLVPVAGNTLTIGSQSVALVGATITETGVSPTVNADPAIAAGVASAVTSKVSV